MLPLAGGAGATVCRWADFFQSLMFSVASLDSFLKRKDMLGIVFGNFRYRIFGVFAMLSTQEQARQLLARTRQQQQHRRANMLGRSTHEVLPSETPQA
ncbi:hypothetical protein NIES30_14395 [Phormidium tenue NIES-30]|uniref:Uncharacterized protein n=1 Tax=Phormidium tenue NIES-30 TaxID=549789 RepID=A0A1U7J416_9CYAN|nr:hypothetical protein NIES30_14395 [Phormidium tenue NIES-30]